jgi:Winged helix-turn helix
MASAVGLREDYSAAELRSLARRSKNVNQSRRLLSLAAIGGGMDRCEAAWIGGLDRQTLRDWVHRFNGSGLEGLLDNWTEVPSLVFRRSNWLSSRRSSRPARIVRRTGSSCWRPARPQARHRREVRRRVSRALCRKASEEAWVLSYERAPAPCSE